MPFQFNWSKRRHDAIEYRRAYKVWVCSKKVGPAPLVPLSLIIPERQRIQATIERLYGDSNPRIKPL